MTQNLLTPILDAGVRHNHYFHGRLLTARDLSDEQEAQHRHDRQLGRVAGAGVADGLLVTVTHDGRDGKTPVLKVTAGLGVNRKGQVLELAEDVSLNLQRDDEDSATDIQNCPSGDFKDCQPPSTDELSQGEGFYVLVLAPASGYREQAPKSGLGGEGKIAGCGSRYAVEGVRFRLEKLDPAQLQGASPESVALLNQLGGTTSDDAAALSKLRNVVAHLCLGTESLDDFPVNPFGGPSSYGLHDSLAADGTLDDCDVPLALLYWTFEGVQYLDLWAARRRPIAPGADGDWRALDRMRREVEAEARLWQFQDHLQSLLSLPSPSSIKGRDHFVYLPPAGFLPRPGAGFNLTNWTSVYFGWSFAVFGAGFKPESFFQGIPYRTPIEQIDGRRLGAIFHSAVGYAPIDLREPELVWLYAPWQQSKQRPYLVFTSGQMPPFATARYDVARWDFSNYARNDHG